MPYTVCRNNYASPNDSSAPLYRNYGSLAECIAHAESYGYGHVQRCSCEERLTETEQAYKEAQEKAMIAETQRLTEIVKSYYEGGESTSLVSPAPQIVSSAPQIVSSAPQIVSSAPRTGLIGEPGEPLPFREIEKTLLTIIIVVVILTMVLK